MAARVTPWMPWAIYGVAAGGLAALSLEAPYVTPLWTMLLLAAGGFAALAVRHRHPHIAFAAAMVLSVLSLAVGSGAESLLVLVALYDAGVRSRAAVTWMHFGVAMVAAAVGALALTMRGGVLPPVLGLQPPVAARDSLIDWANFFVVIAALLLITTLLGTSVGHRRRYIGELVHRAEQLARERDQQAETARAHERERIAREMHDIIAHSLSVMIAISDGAHAASDTRPAEAKEAIGRVADTGRKTLSEVRRLLGSVRGEEVAAHAPTPDASQLASLVQEFTAAGLPVRLSVTGRPPADPALGLTVYRIVQESLTNALRHAQGVTRVDATVTWRDDDVTVAVQDVASVVASPSDAGRGLLGMQERVALYDGEIEAGPHGDGGWRVFARLRWEDR